MRKEKGITMVSLVVYIVVMIIVLGVMSSIITNFYNNTETLQGNVGEIIEFNKFNNYFLKEIKARNNKIDTIKENYILFSTGNSFSISSGIIYYNSIKVCENVNEMKIEANKNEDGVYEDIIKVTLNFEKFNKFITYKIENIY